MNITNALAESENVKHLEQLLGITRLLFGKILTPFVCLIGFIANILNVFILTRSWMSSSTNVYLTAVAICDLFYLLFTFLFTLFLYDKMKRIAFYVHSWSYIYGTANIFSNTTSWLTVCFTVERYIAVSSPILGRRFCTRKRAKIVVTCACLLCILFTFPDYLRKVVAERNVPNANESNRVYMIVDSSINPYLVQFGYDYLNQILFVLIPIVLLITFNSLLVRSVIKANKGRRGLFRQMSSTHKPNHCGQTDSNNTGPSVVDAPEDFRCAEVNHVLEATAKTTIELTSGISQSFAQGITPQPGQQLSSVRTRRHKFGEQQRITVMLISVVMAFVLLQLPSTVPYVIEYLWKADILANTKASQIYMALYSNVSNFLLIINAAMNFVFYSLFSAKFRGTCCMLFQEMTGQTPVRKTLTQCGSMRSTAHRSQCTSREPGSSMKS